MGDKNPIDEVWFYQKNATDKPIRKPKDEASNDVANIFYDLFIQHFWGWAFRGEYFSLAFFVELQSGKTGSHNS